MKKKKKRQRLIKQFVKEYEIDKQERLVELLAKKRCISNTSYGFSRYS